MTTIDGGLLVLKLSSDYDRAKKLRWFGLDKTTPRLQNDITEGGFKYHIAHLPVQGKSPRKGRRAG